MNDQTQNFKIIQEINNYLKRQDLDISENNLQNNDDNNYSVFQKILEQPNKNKVFVIKI